jgi:nucleoside-diphosphate-sugar epimerase
MAARRYRSTEIGGVKMKVNFFGVTGGTGQEVVKQALANGHRVTVFVRNPRKLGAANENLTDAKQIRYLHRKSKNLPKTDELHRKKSEACALSDANGFRQTAPADASASPNRTKLFALRAQASLF